MPNFLAAKTAYFLLFGAVVLWGLNFHEAKIMLRHVHFMEAGFWRYLLAVIFLFILQIGKDNTGAWTLAKQQPKGLLLVGLIGLFAFNIFFFWGLAHTSALNAALLIGLNPSLTLLVSHWRLKTPISFRQKVGIGIAFFGVVLLLTKGRPQEVFALAWSYGDLLILAATTIFALMNVWIKQYAPIFDNLFFTFITNGLCLLAFLIALPFFLGHTPAFQQWDFWLATLGISVLGTSLAYLFWNAGVQKIGAANAGVFANAIPLSAAFFALFFGEALHAYHLLSGVVILSGVLYTQMREKA